MGEFKHSFSRSIAGRVPGRICACFFAALVIAFLILPAKEISAAGAAKPYPAEAFNGKWDAEDKVDAAVATMTVELHGDGTIYYSFYSYFPSDKVFLNGMETTTEYYGTYTYDETTGELTTSASSESLSIAMGTMTEKVIWMLTDINTLELRMIEFDGNSISPPPNIYYRLSDTPVYAEEEEEDAATEESVEEASVPEEEVEEAEEEAEEEASEEEAEEDESAAEASEEAADAAEAPEQLLTDEEAEKLLISIFEGDDEHLDLAKTAAVSVGMTLGGFVSALLAAGTLGGGPAPTGGAEGDATGSVGPGPIGPGMTMDSDGDIHYTNPFTNKESVYLSNGDGTYRNALTGVDVTIQDINDIANHEFDNASEMALEQEKLDQWKEEQRQANSVLSKEGQQAALDRIRQEQFLAEQDRKNQIMYKRGIYDGDEKAFKKTILKERQEENEKFGKYAAAGEYWDAATKTAESVKNTADIAIDVMAEIEPTGAGKSIKNGYKFLSEAATQSGKCMAGKQSLKQAIGKTLVNGALNYVKDNIPNSDYSNELKCLVNVTGSGAAEYFNTRVIDGKSHEVALKKASDAAVKGAGEFAVDYTVGKVMDGVTEGIEIKDNKIYNGIYKNNNVTGDSVSKLGQQMHASGFTKAPVKNDNFKEGASAFVSDLIKLTFSDDDDD